MVRAKCVCVHKAPIDGGFSVTLNPVTTGSEENDRFYRMTPYGSIHMGTVNESAAEQFEVGQEYYVVLIGPKKSRRQ